MVCQPAFLNSHLPWDLFFVGRGYWEFYVRCLMVTDSWCDFGSIYLIRNVTGYHTKRVVPSSRFIDELCEPMVIEKVFELFTWIGLLVVCSRGFLAQSEHGRLKSPASWSMLYFRFNLIYWDFQICCEALILSVVFTNRNIKMAFTVDFGPYNFQVSLWSLLCSSSLPHSVWMIVFRESCKRWSTVLQGKIHQQ